MTLESEKRRIFSIDLLRGVVMMIMLLDHTRDFVHAGAMQIDPTDPATTTVPLFFTRWITHFCAPAFVFLSGASIYLQKLNGKSNRELSRFLFTRGLWLILMEFTVVRFGVVFNLDYSFFALVQVIWVIGVSMIVMAALIYLPVIAVGAFGVVMIFAHNLLDGIRVPPNVAFAAQPPPDLWQTIWILLHQQGMVPLFGGASTAFVAYPLIPWVGVMAAGYAFGKIYGWDAGRRQRFLLVAGISAVVLFIVLRFANVYGDPSLWREQATATRTVLSFLNTTKYPPSLLFLLMTLGPSLLVLWATDRIDGKALWQRICITFGRVPMFYYLLQFPLAHAIAVVLTYFAGRDIYYLFVGMGQGAEAAPANYGFSLPVVYAAWIAGLLILYPLCYWYGNYKRRNKHWALSYL